MMIITTVIYEKRTAIINPIDGNKKSEILYDPSGNCCLWPGKKEQLSVPSMVYTVTDNLVPCKRHCLGISCFKDSRESNDTNT